jgi:hypothetical protein
MKRRQYYKRPVKRHYGGELRGLAHNQLFQQRGLYCTTHGPSAGINTAYCHKSFLRA